MTFSFIGGGAWGATLAQVLLDNGHDVMIYEINPSHRALLEKHQHPFFKVTLPYGIKVTDDLTKALDFSEYIILAVPTKFFKNLVHDINNVLTTPKIFINVSKGFILPDLMTMSQYMNLHMKDKVKHYFCLTGPSHAEEVIERNLTSLVCSGDSVESRKEIALAFNNRYMRLYMSDDLIGSEVAGASKNAIAVTSGILTALEYGENARAALLTKGLHEMKAIILAFGGKEETATGLTGIGDLIVTGLSMHSRNFKAGLKIGQGMERESIETHEKQTIEGFLTIQALYAFGKQHQLHLPIIETAYEIIFNKRKISEIIEKILDHHVKIEQN
ncbi:MAG: NAD(P)H-dependent glycerol-3-phosphate dehydrogenase [Firmicutes bacterium]|nr:NAD(P)H-dependent glycerol-3-phosphate dehydrogenase [Bacillota bacterium]